MPLGLCMDITSVSNLGTGIRTGIAQMFESSLLLLSSSGGGPAHYFSSNSHIPGCFCIKTLTSHFWCENILDA